MCCAVAPLESCLWSGRTADDRPGFLIAFRLLNNKALKASLFSPSSPRAAMAELHQNLAGLHGLYKDLSAISDSSLVNIDRLMFELDVHIEDFRKLLDKPAKNNESRQRVLSGRSTLSCHLFWLNLPANQELYLLQGRSQ